MAARRSKSKSAGASDRSSNGAPLGFEAQLWAAADALRNNMDAAEYKHVVLGLIFLKYISDAFEAKHAELEARRRISRRRSRKIADEYRAASIFWVPPEARWALSQVDARPQPTIGTARGRCDERHRARQPLSQGRAAQGLRPPRPGQISVLARLINLVSDIAFSTTPVPGEGSATDRSKDTLGRVYEYFLSRFASAEGKSGGQFYTPIPRGPCAGRDARAVQGPRLRPLLRLRRHVRPEPKNSSRPTAGKLGDISIYGQESNYTTWRLAKMNLAIRGIDAQIGHGDTFHSRQRTPTSRRTMSSPTRPSTTAIGAARC